MSRILSYSATVNKRGLDDLTVHSRTIQTGLWLAIFQRSKGDNDWCYTYSGVLDSTTKPLKLGNAVEEHYWTLQQGQHTAAV